jgi:hypothetical protein
MTRVGDDLVEALTEMAAYLRGEIEAESYDLLLNSSPQTPIRSCLVSSRTAPAAVGRTPNGNDYRLGAGSYLASVSVMAFSAIHFAEPRMPSNNAGT